MNDQSVWSTYFGLFDQFIETDAENPVVQVIRSIYKFGSPVQVTVDGEVIRYKDKTDREAEQLEHFNNLLLYPYVEKLDEQYEGVDSTGFETILYAYSLE